MRASLPILVFLISLIAGCSDSEKDEDTKKPANYGTLSFRLNGVKFTFVQKDPNSYPGTLDSFQFGAHKSNNMTSVSFYNPYNVQQAPCFTVNQMDNTGYVCGFMAFGTYSNQCGSAVLGTDGTECSYDESYFDPSNYDQSKIYPIDNLITNLSKSCRTYSVYDVVSGQYHNVETCYYTGTFSFEARNAAGETMALTEGTLTYPL